MTAGIVIIGAGECGGRAALGLRELGYNEPVTLIGEEAHLPYERPPLSKDAMTALAPGIKTVTSEAEFADRSIKHLRSITVKSIDRATKSMQLSDGHNLAYDRLLLATGAQPRKLRMPGLGARCVYLRTFDEALAIRTHLRPGNRVAIIGGGFIGLELAASARKMEAEVTLVEAQPRILMRGVPAEIASRVHAAHEAHGVEIICGVGIRAIEDNGSEVRLSLADGRIVEANLVVIGIGAVPVTGLAEQAGLRIENGIAVDETLRTEDSDIFAAGDCCSFPLSVYGGRRVRLEAWRNALEQAELVAGNMLGAGVALSSVPWFWSDQYDLTLQIAGLSDEGCTTVRRDLGKDALILFHLAEDGRLVAASGLGQGNAIARDIRVSEMLIAKRAKPNAVDLASSDIKLKKLLDA